MEIESLTTIARRERQETLLNAPPRPVVVQRAEDMLELTTIRPRLREMVAQLMVAAEYVKPDRTAEAEEVLQEAINALSRLVDRRRIRDTATKQALNAAVSH